MTAKTERIVFLHVFIVRLDDDVVLRCGRLPARTH